MAKKSRNERLEKMKARQKREKTVVTTGSGGGFISFEGYEDAKFLKMEKEKRYDIALVPYEVSGLYSGIYSAEAEFEKGELWYKAQVYVHKGIGPNTETVICLSKTFGLPCPICEEAEATKDKDLRPKWNPICYYNAVNLKTGEFGLFSANQHFFEKDVWKEAKAQEDEIDNLCEVGISLRIDEEVFSEGKKTVTYTRPSNYHFVEIDPDEIFEKYGDKALPLDTMIKKPSYDQVKDIFEGVTPDEEQEEERPTRAERSKPVEKKEEKEPDPEPEEPKADKDLDLESLDIDEMDREELEELCEKLNAQFNAEIDDLPKKTKVLRENLRELIDELKENTIGGELEVDEKITFDQINSMSLKELKQYAKDNDLSMGSGGKKGAIKELCKQLGIEIPEEKPKKQNKSKTGKCPNGYKFGHECNNHDDCGTDDCDDDTFEKCAAEFERLEEAGELEE